MSATTTKPAPGKDRLITPEEALDRLGILKDVKDVMRTVSSMNRRGEIRAVMVGKFLRVSEASVDAKIAGQR